MTARRTLQRIAAAGVWLIELIWYADRVLRMTVRFARGHISLRSFAYSFRPRVRAIGLVGGGMAFCDRRDERAYFS